jgi:hypothetical protein
LGQVVSGCRFWADGSPVAGQDFTYAFDDIGNRTSTGGRASAASTYTVNRLNQYSSRTVAPYVDVLGVANPTTNVTVNGNTANRKGEYFQYPLNVPNTSAQIVKRQKGGDRRFFIGVSFRGGRARGDAVAAGEIFTRRLVC